MNSCAVIVPVYKDELNEIELKSFNQLLKILSKHPIVLITFKALNTKVYKNVSKLSNINIQFQYFDEIYFRTLLGYNSLCLSKKFYSAFSKYKHILIYQLDAYVFSDQLDDWCSKDFDYIGAPWFDDNRSHNDGAQLWAVGNGGFSLRKTATFIRLFETRKSAYSLKYLLKKLQRDNKSFGWLLKAWLLKTENNFQYLITEWDDAEDLFYCLKLADTNFRLKIPTVDIALDFAFEQSPAHLFKLNNNKLPFGCHAWEKYEYMTFWKEIININE